MQIRAGGYPWEVHPLERQVRLMVGARVLMEMSFLLDIILCLTSRTFCLKEPS